LLSKNCIFDILNNIRKAVKDGAVLWIAFKKLYLWYSEQLYITIYSLLGVVNCFQKIVSLIFWTTFQRMVTDGRSCELLSKNCIFDILNNSNWNTIIKVLVVNCFQKIVSLIFWTTTENGGVRSYRCELLSKNCIFDILNNHCKFNILMSTVVNCFQKIVSLIFWTTTALNASASIGLWIAFKKLYLWYSEQQDARLKWKRLCCELLSNSHTTFSQKTRTNKNQ